MLLLAKLPRADSHHKRSAGSLQCAKGGGVGGGRSISLGLGAIDMPGSALDCTRCAVDGLERSGLHHSLVPHFVGFGRSVNVSIDKSGRDLRDLCDFYMRRGCSHHPVTLLPDPRLSSSCSPEVSAKVLRSPDSESNHSVTFGLCASHRLLRISASSFCFCRRLAGAP